MKFPFWKTSENSRPIELVQWVRSLTNEELVDLQLCVWDQYRSRKFPLPSKWSIIFPSWGERVLATKLMRFCRTYEVKRY